MTDKKKTAITDPEKATAITHPVLDYSGHKDVQENESWRQWKVKPDLTYIPAPVRDEADFRATEAGIAKRIAYCRGQLDNLSVEALARYTKYFDQVGVSKASIVRYEAGESLPGARELRILCGALWVSPNWMLTGIVDPENKSQSELEIALQNFVLKIVDTDAIAGLNRGALDHMVKYEEQRKFEQRQRWLDEARKPTPR